MDAIERENSSLKGVLPKTYARRELTPHTLGGLIDTFSNENLAAEEHDGMDVLGRVFEYMLSQFASAEGKLGGEFFTPRHAVKVMVEVLEPFNGRVYDPACGSGGMFVQRFRMRPWLVPESSIVATSQAGRPRRCTGRRWCQRRPSRPRDRRPNARARRPRHPPRLA